MSEILEEVIVDPALSGEFLAQSAADPALSGDMFLKFSDEAEMLSVLFHDVPTEWATVTDEETGEVTKTPIAFESRPRFANTDIVGTIYRPTGNTLTDDEGNEYPEQEVLDGFHVNIRAEAPIEELETYRVYPNAPARVWL
jgi:hypothetical protein